MARETIGIFMTTYYRQGTARRCLESVLATMASDGYDVFLSVTDNGSDQGLVSYLTGLAEARPEVSVECLKKNIGKAEAVNRATARRKFDWFVSCDSDIFHAVSGWPGLLADCYKAIPEAGMVSVGYVNNGNAPMPLQPNRLELNVHGRQYSFHWGEAVAGGCFVSHRKVWKRVKYRSAGVYGGVDGIYRGAVSNKLKLKCGYIDEIRVEHLDDRNETGGYYDWKVAIQMRMREHSPFASARVLGSKKGYWDK